RFVCSFRGGFKVQQPLSACHPATAILGYKQGIDLLTYDGYIGGHETAETSSIPPIQAIARLAHPNHAGRNFRQASHRAVTQPLSLIKGEKILLPQQIQSRIGGRP